MDPRYSGSADHEISSTVPDWSRESQTIGSWNPGKSLLRSIRRYQEIKSRDFFWAWLFSRLVVLQHRFWSCISGADIPINTRIEGGLLIPHPNGIVIHPDVKIGPNCLIFQQVTLGSDGKGVPTIAGQVDIGAGAKVLGAVTLNERSKIGANAVVLQNVPARCTAIGIPARIVARYSPPPSVIENLNS
jgi:serine O-acetyltransferase